MFISRHMLMKDDEDSSPADGRWWSIHLRPRFQPSPTLRVVSGNTVNWRPPSVAPCETEPGERGGGGSSAPPIFTILAGVVHQDDLLQEDGRGGVQDAVDGPQQGAPCFVVKHDDHAGGWQGGAPLEGLLNTSVAKKKKKREEKTF